MATLRKDFSGREEGEERRKNMWFFRIFFLGGKFYRRDTYGTLRGKFSDKEKRARNTYFLEGGLEIITYYVWLSF